MAEALAIGGVLLAAVLIALITGAQMFGGAWWKPWE